MQLAMCKIGADLNLFQALKDSDKPVTLSQLAEKTGAAPGILGECPHTIILRRANDLKRTSCVHKPPLA